MTAPTDRPKATDGPVPRAFAYYRLADSPHGQAVRQQLEKLTRSGLGLPDDTARREFLRENLEGGEAKFQPVDKLTR
jgi:hypothetical protein